MPSEDQILLQGMNPISDCSAHQSSAIKILPAMVKMMQLQPRNFTWNPEDGWTWCRTKIFSEAWCSVKRGWWLVGGLETCLFFHILGIVHPTDSYFSDGWKHVETTDQIMFLHQPAQSWPGNQSPGTLLKLAWKWMWRTARRDPAISRRSFGGFFRYSTPIIPFGNDETFAMENHKVQFGALLS